MFPSSMRLQQLKPYLRGVLVLAILGIVFGIAFMYGTHPSHAQTATAPTPAAGCVGGTITIAAGSDSSYQLAAIQDLMASRSQDECNATNYTAWVNSQLNFMAYEIAVLQAAAKITPPPPCNLPNLMSITGVCSVPGSTPPPPVCNAPNTLVNGVCTPPTTTPPPTGNPIVPNGKVIVNAGGADQSLCFAGGQIVPAGTTGTVTAGPKTFISVPCWNITFSNGMNGYTPASALSGQ
jgi:hypothetical protein